MVCCWSTIQTYNERCGRGRSGASLRQGGYRKLHQLQTMQVPLIIAETLSSHPFSHVGSSHTVLRSHSAQSTHSSSGHHSAAQCCRGGIAVGFGSYGSGDNSEDIAILRAGVVAGDSFRWGVRKWWNAKRSKDVHICSEGAQFEGKILFLLLYL